MSDIYYITGFYNDDHKVYAKCINYCTLDYSVISTSYSFLSVAVIENNHMNHFLDAMKLYQTTSDNTTKINLIHNFDINGSCLDIYKILTMHQGYDVDDCWKGTLVIFDSQSLSNCRDITEYMKAFICGKPSYGATQDSFDLLLSMQMHMFLVHYTSELPRHKSLNSTSRIGHLVCGYETTNLEDIFAPCGFYRIEDNAERVTYIPTIQDTFIDKLPILILDIETVANDMNIVPLGVSQDQRISSLVLKAIYFDVKIYYVLYLHESYTEEAAVFDRNFATRYTDPEHNIYMYVKGYPTDGLLIEAFMDLYATGKILESLTGNKHYPHIFTGHNILEYDIPVIANIMKRRQMHTLFDNHVTIENIHKSPVIIRLHRSAIYIDIYQMAKRNLLSAVGYSLKAMAKAASSDDNKQKYDLNSVNIRKWYILEKCITNDRERQLLAVYFRLQPNVESELAIVESTKEHNFNNLSFDIITIPNDAFAKAPIKVRVLDSLEKILIYNMTDCTAVGNILFSNNYFNLVLEFAKMFNMDMESACYFGNSARLKSCIQSQQLNFKHFFGVTNRTDHVLVLNSAEKFLRGLNLDNVETRVEPAISWNTSANSKAYTGALNYAKPGLMPRVFGIDFVSYYPNLLCARQMSMHRISQVTTSRLLSMPQLAFLESLIHGHILTLYCAEDVNPEKSLVLSYRGREIAHRLSMADLKHYHTSTNGQGKVIVFVEESQPDAFYRIAQSLLARRGFSKKQLKETKLEIKTLKTSVSDLHKEVALLNESVNGGATDADAVAVTSQAIAKKQSIIANTNKRIEHLHKLENVRDATQLCLKIVVNSLYGVLGASNFAYSHVPMAALITLLGRAKLALCSRLAVYYYYKEILTNDLYCDKCRHIINDDGETVLAVPNMSKKMVTIDHLEEHFKYLCEIAPFHHKNEIILSRFAGDGDDDNDGGNDSANNGGNDEGEDIGMAGGMAGGMVVDAQQIFSDTDIIIYTDTDGILFTNHHNIDCDVVLHNINRFIVERFPTDCLILEADKKYDIIGILGKKAYFMSNAHPNFNVASLMRPPASNYPTVADVQKLFQNIKSKHNGYERNAPPHIKRIYNYVVALCYICNAFGVEVNLIQFFFDMFSYLQMLNQYTLITQIPLNEHVDKSSTLAQYIERNTTTYKGSVATMYILNTANIAEDCYRTLIEWENNQVPIHYVKTMKNHFKTLWRILNMCKFSPVHTTFLETNSVVFIKKMQWYANLIYSLWGDYPTASFGKTEVDMFRMHFNTDKFVYEKNMQCRDNVTSDDICTKTRSDEQVRLSYDIDQFELPNFICESICQKLIDRMEMGVPLTAVNCALPTNPTTLDNNPHDN